MGADTAIEWAHATFNPWTGCTRVSPGCDNCYAAAQAKRSPSTFGSWAPGGARKRTSAAYWKQPLRWNREAERTGTRPRVFCASMADVFDNQVPEDWRADLWGLITSTPHLDWLLLTKRPQNIAGMLPPDWGTGWPNVWLGTTVENQAEADRRIPHLLAVPARVRFLSCEPLLGAVDLRNWIGCHPPIPGASTYGGFDGLRRYDLTGGVVDGLHWVIAGGESGPGARPMDVRWAIKLRTECRAAGVPFFMKQMGRRVIDRNDAGFDGDSGRAWNLPCCGLDAVEHDIHGYREEFQGADVLVTLGGKGAAMDLWPKLLRLREVPA